MRERIRYDTSRKDGQIILTCTCACVLSMCMVVSVQDPPNAELVCKVNGVATTTAVTLTAPVLMTDDESGAMRLTYDVELLSMARGGPTVFNATVPAETIDEEELECDDGTGVSLFIDTAPSSSQTTDMCPLCPSPTSCESCESCVSCNSCC